MMLPDREFSHTSAAGARNRYPTGHPPDPRVCQRRQKNLVSSVRCFGPIRFGTNDVDTRLRLTYSVHMVEARFVWDERKNRSNQLKHGVTFEEARASFLDENAKIYADPDHSEDEDRFILLGISFRIRTLVVCHCYREEESVIRIVSARKADKSEQRDYWS